MQEKFAQSTTLKINERAHSGEGKTLWLQYLWKKLSCLDTEIASKTPYWRTKTMSVKFHVHEILMRRQFDIEWNKFLTTQNWIKTYLLPLNSYIGTYYTALTQDLLTYLQYFLNTRSKFFSSSASSSSCSITSTSKFSLKHFLNESISVWKRNLIQQYNK